MPRVLAKTNFKQKARRARRGKECAEQQSEGVCHGAIAIGSLAMERNVYLFEIKATQFCRTTLGLGVNFTLSPYESQRGNLRGDPDWLKKANRFAEVNCNGSCRIAPGPSNGHMNLLSGFRD